MQELFFKGKDNFTSASVWIQSSVRNIPPNILSTTPPEGERQTDKFIRALVRHSKYTRKSSFEAVSGIFYEDLNYFNKQVSINSLNHFTSFTGKATWDHAAAKNTRIKIIADDEFSIVNSVNYTGIKSRNVFSLSGIVKKAFSKNIAVTMMLRETADRKKILAPDYSAGFEFYPGFTRDFWIKFNQSKNTRIPTLNDIYWSPGGNPDLKSEYCFSEELNAGLQRKINATTTIESEISAYAMRIRNMIQWLPGEFSYWSPVNFRSVNINGFEINIDLRHSSGNLKYSFSGHYAFNNSVYSGDAGDLKGKKLIYVPVHQSGGTVRAEYLSLYISNGFRYTGKRFTSVDNTSSLKGYFLSDAEAGINIPVGSNKLTVKFRVENVFNASYEAVAYYPMPGRWFILSVNCYYSK